MRRKYITVIAGEQINKSQLVYSKNGKVYPIQRTWIQELKKIARGISRKNG